MLRIYLLTMGLMLALSAHAEAGAASHWNTLNRKLGLGWSDGYHASNGCGECFWQAHSGAPTAAAPALMRQAPPSSVTRTAREPVLPSQRSTPRPAYWSR
jgi:hypothetical protein